MTFEKTVTSHNVKNTRASERNKPNRQSVLESGRVFCIPVGSTRPRIAAQCIYYSTVKTVIVSKNRTWNKLPRQTAQVLLVGFRVMNTVKHINKSKKQEIILTERKKARLYRIKQILPFACYPLGFIHRLRSHSFYIILSIP